MQPVQPIDSLTPFLGGKWRILARVTDKSDIRTWNKPASQGKLFSFTLIDESAAIRATVFNDAVDAFEPMLVNGSLYYFSGGQVKAANRKFNNVNNDYELTFDRTSEITLARDAGSVAIPQQRYNFVPIEILKQREQGSVVDILAVVLNIEEPITASNKSTGREFIRRNIKVGDSSAAVELTLWNEHATEWSYPVGSVLAMRQLKVGNFNGVNLSAISQSVFEPNPNLPDAKKISNWYISTGGNDVTSLSGRDAAGAGGAGGEQYKGRKYFSDIAAEGLGKGAKADFIDVRCVPIYLKPDGQWYDACPQCNKKVTQEGAQGDRFRCEKCDREVVPTQRYLVSLQATDNVTQMWLTLFNEAGTEFFGMSASDFKKQQEDDPKLITKLAQARMNRPVLMRIRVKEDPRDGADASEDRIRLTVSRITEFMPLDVVSEERRLQVSDNLRIECEDMIQCIESYA